MSPLYTCPCCGGPVSTPQQGEHTFPYGDDTLSASVSVYQCEPCDAAFTDAEADLARHLAVCRHLSLLPPRQILASRGARHMTTKQVAQALGVTERDVEGWEFGYTLQTKEQDNALRELFASKPEAFEEK